MNTVELKQLIGKHKLSGVDFENESIKRYEYSDFEDCQVIRFCIDGKTYIGLEDPSDGYRSCMKECFVVKEKPKNMFKSIEVYCIMKEPYDYHEHDMLQVYDTKTNKIILEVGTKDISDYYPSFVANWYPENMCLNSNF
ncbi:MAG: hypothetical protein KGL95_10110 [Patescibacteria group bacterium]|nr:hypothetical protein [Patescibacteria group bacterium]